MITRRSPLALLFIPILVVFVIAIWQLRSQNSELTSESLNLNTNITNSSPTKSPEQITILPNDPILGNVSAPTTLVEFSDFACPYCAEMAPILAEVVGGSNGQVRLVWKDFPLPEHKAALGAAEAAQCAGKQGKFWEFNNKLFTNQTNLGAELYRSLAAELSMDLTIFARCLDTHETLPLIQHNIAEATAIGVDGTPYFIAKGKVYSGTLTVDEVKEFIK
jgi:protein-disulfide isomerase